ncbi:MAG: divalent-cation tolerance protein CutA [Acuticoccus sp.]
MADDALWFVIINCPSLEVADTIGKGALTRGLAKAYNIPAEMKTAYVWKGEIVDNREWQLVFKIAAKDRKALFAFAKAEHPFEVPSILAWPVPDGDPDYQRYIVGE